METPARDRRDRRTRRIPRFLPVVVVLLVIVLVVGGLLFWRSYNNRAGGTNVYKESVDTGPAPAVQVKNGLGRVQVETQPGLKSVNIEARRHARGADTASAQQRAATVAINIKREGNTLTIEAAGKRNTGVDYVIQVPPDSSVEVSTKTGNVSISGVNGNVTARTGAGDATVSNVRGSVTLDIPSGDVTLENVSTETGQARLKVGTGNVTLRNLVLGTLDTTVDAGDAIISGRFRGGGQVYVDKGNITLEVPAADVANLKLNTNIGEVITKPGPPG